MNTETKVKRSVTQKIFIVLGAIVVSPFLALAIDSVVHLALGK